MDALLASVESHTLALFTRVLGYTLESTQIEIAGVKNEIRARSCEMQMYTTFYFVFGRKP